MTDKAGDNAYKDRFIVGFVEPVMILGKEKQQRLLARVDSGATSSSIDKKVAEDLDLGPVIGQKLIKNANGQSRRDVIKVRLQIGDEEYEEDFTLADRSRMNFPVLLGRNILEQNFLIDPKKLHKGEEE